jgi:hypothetical protein
MSFIMRHPLGSACVPKRRANARMVETLRPACGDDGTAEKTVRCVGPSFVLIGVQAAHSVAEFGLPLYDRLASAE